VWAFALIGTVCVIMDLLLSVVGSITSAVIFCPLEVDRVVTKSHHSISKVNEILEKEIEIEPTDLSWIEKIKEVSKKQDAKLDKIEKWLTSFIKEQKQEKDEIVWLSKILTKIELEQETERKMREEEERKQEEMKHHEKEKKEREEEEMLSSLLEEEFRIFEENQKQEKIKELEAEKEEIEKELKSLTK